MPGSSRYHPEHPQGDRPETSPMTMLEAAKDHQSDVVVIGSINMDLVARAARIPSKGETVHGTSFATIPGGKGANQAVATARLGTSVAMIGRVGQDAFGGELIKALTNEHIDTWHVCVTEGCSSGIAQISVDQDGQNAITVVSGANGWMSHEDIDEIEPMIANAKVIMLQLEIPLDVVRYALQVAHKYDVVTMLDPAPVPDEGFPDDLFEVDILCPNQIEVQRITGMSVSNAEDARTAAAHMIERGTRYAIIKLGADGAVIVGNDGLDQLQPAFRVDVEDTTGAGDAFAGGLATGIVERKTMLESVRLACAAGGLATTRLGAQRAMPTRREAAALMTQKP